MITGIREPGRTNGIGLGVSLGFTAALFLTAAPIAGGVCFRIARAPTYKVVSQSNSTGLRGSLVYGESHQP